MDEECLPTGIYTVLVVDKGISGNERLMFWVNVASTKFEGVEQWRVP